MQLLPSNFISNCVRMAQKELDDKGIKFEITFYASTEWGVPNKNPIIAIPYTYFYPLFKAIEEDRIALDKKGILSILHHEIGHCILYAYKIFEFEKPSFKDMFGDFEAPYPDDGFIESFKPILIGKEFVRHLPDCNWSYAAIHPDEDWAETWAIWMEQKRKFWEQKYSGGKALEKIFYVDTVMKMIIKSGLKPSVTEGKKHKPLHEVILK